MVSERQLSRGFSAWWRQIAPGLSVRWLAALTAGTGALATGIDRWAEPIVQVLPPRDNDLIAEVAFGLFALARQDGVAVAEVEAPRIVEIVDQATRRIMALRASGRDLSGIMTTEHLCLAAVLATRLQQWVSMQGGPVAVQPRLPGMGIVDSCHPDLIVGKELVEVKMGQSLFRISDIRQLLVYAALMWHCPERSLERVTLTNPRLGVTWGFGIAELVRDISGRAPSAFFRDLNRLCCGESIRG